MSNLLDRVAKLVYSGDWQMRNSKRVVALLSDAMDVIEKRNAEIERLRAAVGGVPEHLEYEADDLVKGGWRTVEADHIAWLRTKAQAVRDALNESD